MSSYTRWYRDGTIKTTAGSTEITGSGTYWESAEINPGDMLEVNNNGLFYEIASVNSDTSITLARAYQGTTATGAAYAVVRNFTSTMPSRLAAQVIEMLGNYQRYIDEDMQTVQGKSAYEVAKQNGYTGTVEEWLESLKAAGELLAINKIIEPFTYHNAAAHNAIFRGKNLGSAITPEQSAAIRAGTFIDIYPGDYWRITVPAYTWTDAEGTEHEESGFARDFMILGCNSMLSHGGMGGFTSPHVVVRAKSNLYVARMNDTASTEGGYYNSEMYTKNLLRAEAIVKAAFGEDHVLAHPDYVCNAVTDGKESGWVSVTDRIVDLLSEEMVIGHARNTPYGGNLKFGASQLPAFLFYNEMISEFSSVLSWLRDAASATQYSALSPSGGVEMLNANHSSWGGVNPFFLVH